PACYCRYSRWSRTWLRHPRNCLRSVRVAATSPRVGEHVSPPLSELLHQWDCVMSSASSYTITMSSTTLCLRQQCAAPACLSPLFGMAGMSHPPPMPVGYHVHAPSRF